MSYTLFEIFIFCPKIQLWFTEKIVTKIWVKNYAWKCCGFGLFNCWQLWFHEPFFLSFNCGKTKAQKRRFFTTFFCCSMFFDKKDLLFWPLKSGACQIKQKFFTLALGQLKREVLKIYVATFCNAPVLTGKHVLICPVLKIPKLSMVCYCSWERDHFKHFSVLHF